MQTQAGPSTAGSSSNPLNQAPRDGATSSSNRMDDSTRTILSTLLTLLNASEHPSALSSSPLSPSPSSAYSHSYAPSRVYALALEGGRSKSRKIDHDKNAHSEEGVQGKYKGKGRERDEMDMIYGNRTEQEKLLRSLKEGLRDARDILSRAVSRAGAGNVPVTSNTNANTNASVGSAGTAGGSAAAGAGAGAGRDEKERVARAMKDV
jgi:hypothetical protein